jgi:hypothetical protein
MEGRPEAHEESEYQENQCPCLCERGHERGDTEQQIHHSAEVRDTEPHDDDADVVKSALEKICGHAGRSSIVQDSQVRQSSSRSSCRRRAGSARMSISTIFPLLTAKPMTANGRPSGSQLMIPGIPFTSANRAD